MRQFAEADAADAELTHVTMRSPAELAAVVSTDRKLRSPLAFLDQALFCQKSFLSRARSAETGNSIPEIRAKSTIAGVRPVSRHEMEHRLLLKATELPHPREQW